MKPWFADAFFYVALLNRADEYHTAAAGFAQERQQPIVTTQWVLMEVSDAFAGSRMRERIAPFIRALEAFPLNEIVPVTSTLFHTGLELYHSRKDKEWTLTDCTSFVVMAERNISDVLTLDHHFAQAGFKPLFN